MKFSVDVENISKILFLDFSFFENMSLKNISAWLGGNLLLRLLPETVVAGHKWSVMTSFMKCPPGLYNFAYSLVLCPLEPTYSIVIVLVIL